MRVGVGFDAHAFVAGRPLMLGGIQVPFERGLDGHSDADVLVHAVIDALLGAAGLGDIGTHFPAGPATQGATGTAMLAQVASLLAGAAVSIVNVDAVVIAQAPAIASYRLRMAAAMADALGVGPGRISVKGTTTDGMGFSGREEGISATAVALVRSLEQEEAVTRG